MPLFSTTSQIVRTGGFIFIALLCSAMVGTLSDQGGSEHIEFRAPSHFPKTVYNLSTNQPSDAGFELGRRLFYDPILSGDYMTSCASCHQRFAAFAHVDHALSHGVIGTIGTRNVPALQNLAWSQSFMADGGITHLDLQPIAPLTNPIEMNETLENVLKKLSRDSVYPRMFQRAFGDTAISSTRMLKALSQFLLMLVSANSRYDKMLRGELRFNEQEQRGLQVFRQRCSGCHTEPLMSDQSFRNIGLPPDTALRDSGRARISAQHEDVNRFKVPSLRNVEWTYPYMHDGRFRTLGQVLDFYANSTIEQKSTSVDAEMAKAVGLSAEEKSSLLVFLKTLSDPDFLHDRRFADPLQR